MFNFLALYHLTIECDIQGEGCRRSQSFGPDGDPCLLVDNAIRSGWVWWDKRRHWDQPPIPHLIKRDGGSTVVCFACAQQKKEG